MKIKRSYLEAGTFVFIYLFAIYMWTLPFQDNNEPYGEFDAISHYELGDFIAQYDNTFVYLPSFLDYSYSGDNKFKEHTLWYYPAFHTDFAIISAFSNGRMIPIFLTNTIFASAILISVFFVIRRLFGFLPAILSSFLLTFSMRDIMPFLWGQWPERFAYAFIPLAMYCFYMYYNSYSKEKNKPIYLYITSLLLAVNVFIHPLVFFHSLAGLFVLGIALVIKHRKIPFNLKHIGIFLLIFLVLFSMFPYQAGNVLVSFKRSNAFAEQDDSVISRLLQWSLNPEDYVGSVPASYFSFDVMHGNWTLLQKLNFLPGFLQNLNFLMLFLIAGIAILVMRRENKDIFLLAWLISLYLILHRDLIGHPTFLHRSLSASAHIFVSITIIGALYIFSFFKIPKIYKSFLKYGMVILVVASTLIYNFPAAYTTLDGAYDSPFLRPNAAQVEVSEWIKDNTDENQNVSVIGPFPDIQKKAYWMASYSHRTSYYFEGFLIWDTFKENREEIVRNHLLNDYIVFDYTDIGLLQDRSLVEQWLEFEKQNMGSHTLIYNKDNIRVYKYEAT